MNDPHDWPRVPLTVPPRGPGLSMEETERALLAVCQRFWSDDKIPVVAWGSELDGTELLPPRLQ